MKFSLEQVESFGVAARDGVGVGDGVATGAGVGVGVTSCFGLITIVRSSRFDSENSELPG
jgi:hypothetical protein